ncbi:hypothetical protein [Pseudomonas helleri]|uniref:hypothetical protein n=1 Tax=Pseudomonas helleri TaxID=1608996 RepID=UPI0030DD7BA5
MNQDTLYTAINECEFTVLVFSDHPNFFSSWSITIEKEQNAFMIEHDGRDGWLILYRQSTTGIFEEIDRKTSYNLNSEKKSRNVKHGY